MSFLRVVDVRQYGARGDGVADDSDAIIAADAAADAVLGGVVFFPAGDYLTTKPLAKSPRTRWVGEGQRTVDSVTPLNNVQGTRLVVEHDGDAVTITGPGAGSGVNQRGGMANFVLYGDADTYPNARGIVVTGDVREHFFESILTNGFDKGLYASDCKALRFYECYFSGAATTGCEVRDATDVLSFHSQFSGGTYGLHAVSIAAWTGTGDRFQVSGTANLFADGCGFLNFQGGFNDTGTGYGLWVRDCINSRFENAIYYANQSLGAHVKIEATAAGTCAGVIVTGTFQPGSSGTPTGFEFVDGGGAFINIAIGGDVRGMTTVYTGTEPSNLMVLPGLGSAFRTHKDILATVDGIVNLGSSVNRLKNVTANDFRVLGASGDAQVKIRLSAAGLESGPGGASPIDVAFRRAGVGIWELGPGQILRTSGEFRSDVLSEFTPDEGVTVDGCRIKDGAAADALKLGGEAAGSYLQASQATDTGVLTDNSGGVSGDGTIAPIASALTNPAADRDDTRNAVATLAQELNDMRDVLRAAGLMA